jgi:NADH pyrophosphatase NudC (nudix superfamily)
MRRRARKSAHLREALIRELGELLVEMNRLGRRNDALVTRKAREIEALDRQLDGLAQALGERRTVTQVTLAGIAGSCSRCRTLLGTDDRFCSRCGKPVEGEGAGEAEAGAPPAAQLQLETVGVESR